MTFRKFAFKFLRALSYPVVVPYYGIMKLWNPAKYSNFDIFGDYTDIGFANLVNRAISRNDPFTLQTLVQEGIFNYRATMKASDLLLEVLSKMPDNNHFSVVCKDLYDFMPKSERQDYNTLVTVILQAMKQPNHQNRQNSLNLLTFIDRTFGETQFLKTVETLINYGKLPISDLTKLLQNSRYVNYIYHDDVCEIALSLILRLTPNTSRILTNDEFKAYFQNMEFRQQYGETKAISKFFQDLQQYPMLRKAYCDYVKHTKANTYTNEFTELVSSLVIKATSYSPTDYTIIKELRKANPYCLENVRFRDYPTLCSKLKLDLELTKQLFKFKLNDSSIDTLSKCMNIWYNTNKSSMSAEDMRKSIFEVLQTILSVRQNATRFFKTIDKPYLEYLSNNQQNYVFSHRNFPIELSEQTSRSIDKSDLRIKRHRLRHKPHDAKHKLPPVIAAQNTIFKKFASTMTTNDLKRFNFTKTALHSCNTFNLVCKGFYNTVSSVTLTLQNIFVPEEIVDLIKQFVFIDQIKFIKRDDCKALEYLEDLKLTSTSSRPQAVSDEQVAELKALYKDQTKSLQKHLDLHALAHRDEKSI